MRDVQKLRISNQSEVGLWSTGESPSRRCSRVGLNLQGINIDSNACGVYTCGVLASAKKSDFGDVSHDVKEELSHDKKRDC